MALIVVMAVMSGFEFDLRNKILGTNAHIWVMALRRQGHRGPGGRAGGRAPGARRDGGLAFTYNEVLLTAAGRSAGSVLRGIDLASALKTTDFRKTLKTASVDLSATLESADPVFPPDGILLGSFLASTLGVAVGSPVDVLLPLGGDLSPLGSCPGCGASPWWAFFRSGSPSSTRSWP